MDEIDDQEDIASEEEITNVDAEPIDSDSDPDDLDLTILDLNDPNSDHNGKYRSKSSIQLKPMAGNQER